MGKQLDTLLKTRFHGAANIRGIRYQILYSVRRAFELYSEEPKFSAIRLEGLEDIDLLGLYVGDEYVQVKSSERPWGWSKLKEPIGSFLEVYRANAASRFVLAVNFALRGDIARLAQIDTLRPKEKNRVGKKIRKLCARAGATSDEAEGLSSRLTIVSVNEERIWQQLRPMVTEAFRLGSEAVDVYISVLVARFLDWADNRSTVTRTELDGVRGSVGEALAREATFQAYGSGLIERISWESDENAKDFFEGKSVRPGHIVADVDVNRPRWLEKIDSAIRSSGICILRSSSGQGKSTLSFRYAYAFWSNDDTYALGVAETSEHVGMIGNYLRFRAGLGLPLLLLIDNADWRTRMWPYVAQECAALGIRVLVTVRNEDWYRFAREGLTGYEIIEPELDLVEAKEIFDIFRAEGRLHFSVDSPEWAYERIGEPRLLLEYVYLLTHGHMLEERLRDQVKQFSELGEDPGKTELLRRVALADALGAPVVVEDLLSDLHLRDDPQHVLDSLSGEYLDVEGDVIVGLHWVRSDHLATILHEAYPDPVTTALALLGSIPPASVAQFVSSAIIRNDISSDEFVAGLIEKAKTCNVETILAFINGIYEAGEQTLFQENEALFDEAYELMGQSGASILSYDLAPVLRRDVIPEMIELFEDRAQNFKVLEEIIARVNECERGLDLCRQFLRDASSHIEANTLRADPAGTGRLLDWCSLCNVKVEVWPMVSSDILGSNDIFDLPLSDFCNLSQGIFRYDEVAYMDWYSANRENILGYLKLRTECLELAVSDSSLRIVFLPDLDSDQSPHDQTLSRLKKLRSAIPFCERYASQAIWVMPFGLKPSVDDTRKDIPRESLPFETDVEKNVVWIKIVESNYLPDSYFHFEEAWFSLRQNALRFVKIMAEGSQRILAGRHFDFHRALDSGELPVMIAEALNRVPEPPPQTPEPIGAILKGAPKKWAGGLRNFLIQSLEYFEDTGNSELGRLAVHNFLDAMKNLPDMHAAFAQLFTTAPDYFDMEAINQGEIKAYALLADLLDVWIVEPLTHPLHNVMKYIRQKRERNRQEVLNRLRRTISPLQETGMTIILPSNIHLDHPLRYLPLAYSVENPAYPESGLDTVVEAIANVRDISDIFCFVPIYRGMRFLEGGYQLSSSQITEIEEGRFESWESLVPHGLPEEQLKLLGSLPFAHSRVFEFRSLILGLLAAFDVIEELKRKISALQTSHNKFEVELRSSLDEKIRRLEVSLGPDAARATEILESEINLSQEESAAPVQRLLDAVEEISDQGLNECSLGLNDFEVSRIVESLERLLGNG